MTIHFKQQNGQIFVFGQTFPHKEALKSLGARFHGGHKHWYLEDTPQNCQAVSQLCASLGNETLQATNQSPPRIPPIQESLASHSTLPTDMSVRDLVQKASFAIAQNFVSPVWILGEIQNISERQTGMFFQVSEAKDERATASIEVKAVLWRNQLAMLQKRYGDKLSPILCDGTKVRLLVQVSMFADRGQLSLTVIDLDPAFSQGALALARQKLIQELRQSGLYDANSTLSLTHFPFRIGLITAAASRAYSDFCHQLISGRFCGEVFFEPAQMQGEQVTASVTQAIKRLVALDVDLIVVTRGGGSAADLRWFDSREIAFGIARCPLPILAAIGHHDDLSISEEVAFNRQKTPTAAAEYILERFRSVGHKIDDLQVQMSRHGRGCIEQWQQQLIFLQQQIFISSLNYLDRRHQQWQNHLSQLQRNSMAKLQRQQLQIERWQQNLLQGIRLRHSKSIQDLHHLRERLVQSLRIYFMSRDQQLKNHLQNLQRKDPKPWIRQGWTMLASHRGRIKSIRDTVEEMEIYARLWDGKLKLKVVSTEAKGSQKEDGK